MEIPAMDDHRTLKLVMESLFSGNTVKNWSVFADNKCGSTVLKIRFTKPESGLSGEECANQTVIPVAYKKKSDKQSRRDYDRKLKHEISIVDSSVMTRSKKPCDYSHVELPRVSEAECVSEPGPLSPVVCSTPDTSCQSLNCESPDASLDVCESEIKHGSPDTSETKTDADITDRWCSILSQYKNIESGRERNVLNAGLKCSECLRLCDLKSEFTFGFNTVSCNYHNAIVCTECYPKSRHISNCKMKKVKFHV